MYPLVLCPKTLCRHLVKLQYEMHQCLHHWVEEKGNQWEDSQSWTLQQCGPYHELSYLEQDSNKNQHQSVVWSQTCCHFQLDGQAEGHEDMGIDHQGEVLHSEEVQRSFSTEIGTSPLSLVSTATEADRGTDSPNTHILWCLHISTFSWSASCWVMKDRCAPSSNSICALRQLIPKCTSAMAVFIKDRWYCQTAG